MWSGWAGRQQSAEEHAVAEIVPAHEFPEGLWAASRWSSQIQPVLPFLFQLLVRLLVQLSFALRCHADKMIFESAVQSRYLCLTEILQILWPGDRVNIWSWPRGCDFLEPTGNVRPCGIQSGFKDGCRITVGSPCMLLGEFGSLEQLRLHVILGGKRLQEAVFSWSFAFELLTC